jgi:hypothetical protein
MTSITTRPVRVCLVSARCLKLTALFQSSPPPFQAETAVPPSGTQQGERINGRSLVQQGFYQRNSRRGTRGWAWAKGRGPQRIGYIANKPNQQSPMEGSGSRQVQLTHSKRPIVLIEFFLAFAKVCGSPNRLPTCNSNSYHARVEDTWNGEYSSLVACISSSC